VQHESPLRTTRKKTTLTVEEAASVLGLSRSAAYAAAKRGDLPTIRLGRRYLVSAPVLLRLLTTGTSSVDQPKAVAR